MLVTLFELCWLRGLLRLRATTATCGAVEAAAEAAAEAARPRNEARRAATFTAVDAASVFFLREALVFGAPGGPRCMSRDIRPFQILEFFLFSSFFHR